MRLSLEMLKQPPRRLPITLRLQLLFGGFLSQFGWLFCFIGMIAVWVIIPKTDFASIFYTSLQKESAQATITQSQATNFSQNGVRIVANYYAFIAPDGRSFESVSYAKGRRLQTGTYVTVEFPSDKPELSCIRGMRRTLYPFWTAFVLIFPTIGIMFVLFSLRKGVRASHLLQHGLVANGKLTNKERTNVQINNQYVYRLTFAFSDRNGRPYQVQERTHLPEKLEDDEEEPLLYHPKRPTYATMFDSLPGQTIMTERGEWRTKNTAASFIYVLLPLLTILEQAFFIAFLF